MVLHTYSTYMHRGLWSINSHRYIYKLSELHEREQNFTEAGFTLLLHADKLKVMCCDVYTVN